MPRRPRPHIPLSVKIAVAEQQYNGYTATWEGQTRAQYLERLLSNLAEKLGIPVADLRLDHNPALRIREFNIKTGRYKPEANDPDFLIYRTHAGHQIKTFVRGDGAQFSDTTLIKRERRRERKTLKPKDRLLKRGIPARKNPWPEGRKIQSRPFPKRRP